MKLEEYDCVKIKHRAQTRIYEETKDLTPEAWWRTIKASPPPPASGRPSYAPARNQPAHLLRDCKRDTAGRVDHFAKAASLRLSRVEP